MCFIDVDVPASPSAPPSSPPLSEPLPEELPLDEPLLEPDELPLDDPDELPLDEPLVESTPASFPPGVPELSDEQPQKPAQTPAVAMTPKKAVRICMKP
jgi:hypothetical protein